MFFLDNSATGPGDGSELDPWKELSNIDYSDLTSGQILSVEAGFTYHGAFDGLVNNNVTIQRSGAGSNPIFDGSQKLANASFSNTSGAVYQITVATADALTDPMAWEDGARLSEQTSVPNVEANAGSFWLNGTTLHIHPTGSTNPISDGKAYLGSDVPHCIDTDSSGGISNPTDGHTFDGIDCQRGWSSSSGFGNVKLIGDNITYKNFVSKDSMRHGVQIIGASTFALDGTIDDITDSFGISIFKDESIGSAGRRLTIKNSAGYATIHGTSGSDKPVDCEISDCTFFIDGNVASDVTFAGQDHLRFHQCQLLLRLMN